MNKEVGKSLGYVQRSDSYAPHPRQSNRPFTPYSLFITN